MLDYIHDKGFQLGKSEFKRVEEDRELADNERWAEKKDEATDGKRLMEIIVEPGISNKYQLRDEMNVIFFLDLEDSMPEYPWKFRPSSQTKTLF